MMKAKRLLSVFLCVTMLMMLMPVTTLAVGEPIVTSPVEGSYINNTRPTYRGTATANAQVDVCVDDNYVDTVIANGSGNWFYTQIDALQPTNHTIYVFDNSTLISSIDYHFFVNLTPTAVSTPANGSSMAISRPPVTGTACPNSTVTVFIDGASVGTVTADGGGSWSYTLVTDLSDGSHKVKVSAIDAAGNDGGFSSENTFTVDAMPPAAPVVVTPANGSRIGDSTPEFTGTAQAYSTVNINIDNGAFTGTAIANGSGDWSYTTGPVLSEGPHTVRTTATDAAGTSPVSEINTFEVDLTPPGAPIVVTPTNSSTTNDNTPTYSGTADAASIVTVIVDGATVGTCTADASNNWSFMPMTALAEGSHTIRATAKDAAGNSSVNSNTNTFTVDTIAPAAPNVTAPANASITTDSTPTAMGTAEASSTVTMFIDGISAGTTIADGAGNWGFTPGSALADGPHTVKATATDATGNISAHSNTISFTVDTVAPAAPIVVTPANNSATNDTTPTYSGTAEANSTVTIYISVMPIGITTANGVGNFSVTLGTNLLERAYNVYATAADAAGHVSPNSSTSVFTVDLTPPGAPTVIFPSYEGRLSDNTPTYTGLAESNSTITILVDGNEIGTTNANGAGSWSFTPGSAISDGDHILIAYVTDAAQNGSEYSDEVLFHLDSTSPDAPVVNTPANASFTNDTRPIYSGSAESSSTVTIVVDGVGLDAVTADGSGHWSYTQPTALNDGNHDVYAVAEDTYGNVSADSLTNSFTVDTHAPVAPVVVAPANASAKSSIAPVFSGTAEAYSSVTVVLDGTTLGSTTADVTGIWNCMGMSALTEGSHTVYATATDAAGNTGAQSSANTFTVDTVPPVLPILITPALSSSTNDSTPTFTGMAEPGSTVTIYVPPTTSIGTTTAGIAGNWSFTPVSPIPDGPCVVQVTASDAAQNISIPTQPSLFFIDTMPPAAPVIDIPANGFAFPINIVPIAGTAENPCTVTVELDGTIAGTVPASGSWSLPPSAPLSEGTHTVRAFATDAAGNVGAYSGTITFTVDTTPPLAPVISEPGNHGITSDSAPAYSGTAESGSTVNIYLNDVFVGSTTADLGGSWSFTQPVPLPDGEYAVSAEARDSFRTSLRSALNLFTVDTVPPAAPVVNAPANGSLLSDSTPLYTGTAEAGSTVTVYVGGAPLGTVTADMSGNWSFTMPIPMPDGIHTVKALATDSAGNASAESMTSTFTVDATPPVAPILSTPITGSILGMAIPIYSGVAEASSTVIVTVDGIVSGTAVADSEQRWTYIPALRLADGVHTVFAASTDLAGNTSAISITHTFMVDTTPPLAPVVNEPASGSTLYDDKPTYSGTAEVSSVVTIDVDGSVIGTANADSDGRWSFAQPAPLTKGNHTVKAMAMDSAENESPYSGTNTFAVQELVPVNIAAIPGVTPPEKGAAPVAQIIETSQYAGTVAWSPADSTFKPVTQYTATITLSAKAGYTFAGVNKDFFTVQGAASAVNNAGSGIVTAVFPATAPNMYTVTFTSRDAVYTTRSVVSGTSIGSALWPAAPVRSDYTFGGWYTGVNGAGSKFTAASVVSAAITVYAKWTSAPPVPPPPTPTPVPVEVRFNGNATTLVSVSPGGGGLVLAINSGSIATLGPNFSLLVSSFTQPPPQPVLIPPATLAALFNGMLGNRPATPSTGGNSFGSMAALTFPGGLLHSQDGSGALTYSTDIGSITLPSNLLAWVQVPALPQGSSATVTILSGSVAAQQGPGGAPGGNVQLIETSLSLGGRPALQLNPDAPVLLSIPYPADGIPQRDLDRLTVMHIGGNGVVTYLPDSHYNQETGTMDFSTTLLGSFAIVFRP